MVDEFLVGRGGGRGGVGFLWVAHSIAEFYHKDRFGTCKTVFCLKLLGEGSSWGERG